MSDYLSPRETTAAVAARLDLAAYSRDTLRNTIQSEREAGRAFSALAEACRLELATRTGRAAQ